MLDGGPTPTPTHTPTGVTHGQAQPAGASTLEPVLGTPVAPQQSPHYLPDAAHVGRPATGISLSWSSVSRTCAVWVVSDASSYDQNPALRRSLNRSRE